MAADKFRNITQFYYICPIDNLVSVLQNGIYSHNEVESKGLRLSDISNPDVQAIRSRKKVANGSLLHDFVNLYLNPNNAMMATVACHYQEKPCVVLVINARYLLNQSGWYITNGNAASSRTSFYDSSQASEADVVSLVSSAMSEAAAMPADKNWKQASEFLCSHSIAPAQILSVACPMEKLNQELTKCCMKQALKKELLTSRLCFLNMENMAQE